MKFKVKLGVSLPIYGGYLRNTPLEETEISYRYVKAVAQQADDAGLDSVWTSDHLVNPTKGEKERSLEALTTLTAIATATRKVRLGNSVLCQAFRHPALLAKMAASIDEISGGRFLLCLGAGSLKSEFDAFGIPWEEHDASIDRAAEQIQIIRALWSEDVVDFSGQYYQIKQGTMAPKPVQQPIPIWWAGESPHSQELVVRQKLDGWIMGWASPEDTRKKITAMKQRLGKKRMEYAIPAGVYAAESDEEAQALLQRAAGGNAALVDFTIKTGLVGCYDRVAERIHQFEDAGVSLIMMRFSSTLQSLRDFTDNILQ